MKNFLLWLFFSTLALAQNLPWTGSGNSAWLKQSPNALVLPKAGNYIMLSGQTNRISVAGGSLLFDGSPIGGTTIYTGDGTITGNRQVDGGGFALDFVNMNNVSITPEGTDFIAGSISGSPANNTRRVTLNAGLVRLNATTNVTINEYIVGTPGLNGAGIIFDSVSNSPASSDEILFRDPSTHIVKWGSAYTAADVGGGGANFANTDLTATGNRTHDWDGNNLEIDNLADLILLGSGYFDFETGGTFYVGAGGNATSLEMDVNKVTLSNSGGSGGIQFITPNLGTSSVGYVWALQDVSTGQGDWTNAPAGPNFANADLTFTTNRTHDANGFFLNLTNADAINLGAISKFELFSTSDQGNIGFSGDTNAIRVVTYNVAAGAISAGQFLQATDTGGIAEWADLPTLNYTPDFTGGTTRAVTNKLADIVSVADFGIIGDGNAIVQTNLDNLVSYIATQNSSARIFWPGGEYLLPDTLALTNCRAFSFIGEGAVSTTQVKTRIRVAGTGAGHRGVLSLTSCTDARFEGIDFVVGNAGADQAVELKADDIPSLSCLQIVFVQCGFRRFAGVPEFTYAALYIRNTTNYEIRNCLFDVSAIAMRLGNTVGDEPSTYGNGHCASGRIYGNRFFGDIERVNTDNTVYEQNFFDLKTDSSPTEPSVLTASSSELIRNDTLLANYCEPGASSTSRTFYVQGTNVLSSGLFATGNRIGEVNIGFDLIYGAAEIVANNSQQNISTNTFVNIRSTASKVTAWNNNVSALTTAGGSEITDASSGVYKQSPFDAVSPTTTRGDLIVRDASVNTRLPVGGFGTSLRSDGTDPMWFTAPNLTSIFDDAFGTGVGLFSWTSSANGTSSTVTSTTGTAAHPGIAEFQTGTDTTGRSGWRTSASAFLFGGGRMVLQASIRIPTLSDGTDTFTVTFGFHDNSGAAGDATDGAYLIYSSANTYYTNVAKWSGKTASNSNRTEVPSNLTVSANTFYNLMIDVNAAASQVEFFVDGTSIGTTSSNIPTGAGRETAISYKIEKTAGTNNRVLDTDYTYWAFKPTSSR